MSELREVNWERIVYLAEEALDNAALTIQSSLMSSDGLCASVFFSDDLVRDKFISYILYELEDKNSSVKWIYKNDTVVDDTQNFRSLIDAFKNSMAKIPGLNKYFAVINSNLLCCPIDEKGFPKLDCIERNCRMEEYEIELVNKCFQTKF